MDLDVLIVGAGPAGSSAALVLARSRRTILLCDDNKPRNAASHAIHGLLTHEGQSPAAFADASQSALRSYETITQCNERVVSITAQEGSFRFLTAMRSSGCARKVLLATGIVDKLPGIPGLERLYGKSVHHCLYCDGYEYRDQRLAAYGEPSEGVALAMMMLLWSRDIVLCTDGGTLTREQQATLTSRGIEFRVARITSLEERGGSLDGVRFEDGSFTNSKALFFTTGSRPGSDLGEKLGCSLDDKGGLVASRKCETSIPGVFVAGDASRDVLQIAVALGEGVRAGVEINKALLIEDGLCS
jgi:thioredoxin reductase